MKKSFGSIYEYCNLAKVTKALKPCQFDAGLYGLDSPIPLIDKVVNKAKAFRYKSGALDAVIMNGDFVGHGILPDVPESEEKNAAYNPAKLATTKSKTAWYNAIKTVFNEVRKILPGKILLPTIGNNDVLVHNQPPTPNDAA